MDDKGGTRRLRLPRTGPTGPDRGATALEYALIASLIAAVVAVAVAMMGKSLIPIFTSMAGSL